MVAIGQLFHPEYLCRVGIDVVKCRPLVLFQVQIRHNLFPHGAFADSTDALVAGGKIFGAEIQVIIVHSRKAQQPFSAGAEQQPKGQLISFLQNFPDEILHRAQPGPVCAAFLLTAFLIQPFLFLFRTAAAQHQQVLLSVSGVHFQLFRHPVTDSGVPYVHIPVLGQVIETGNAGKAGGFPILAKQLPVNRVFTGEKYHVFFIQCLTAEKASHQMDFLQRFFLAGFLVQTQQPRGAAAVFHHHDDFPGKVEKVLDKGRAGQKIIGKRPFPSGLAVIFQNKKAPVALFVFFLSIIDGFRMDGDQLHPAVRHNISDIHNCHCILPPCSAVGILL